MITIISGVPGTGKTSLIVEMMMEELKAGRQIFTIGIPKLLLNVKEGGDPHTWQDGDWLKIDRFNPELTKNKGIKSQWFPRDCPTSCEYTATCKQYGLNTPPDAGSLVIIDEAHAYFPQRASGKAPPPYIEAMNVHRHQGLDFWILTQRPSFLDPFIRGLCSRHVHLSLNAFSMFGKRVKYEWAEYQETVNRTSKLLASKSDYKPSPAVFPLYASATVHTKLDHRMPTILKMFLLAIVVLVFVVGVAISRVKSRMQVIKEAQANQEAVFKPEKKVVPEVPASRQAVPVVHEEIAHSVDVSRSSIQMVKAPKLIQISACVASEKSCQCYSYHGVKVSLPDVECRESARAPTEKFRLEPERDLTTFAGL